jgi:Nif-specific regulatory protein
MPAPDYEQLLRDREFTRGVLALLDLDDSKALLGEALRLLIQRTAAREAYMEVIADDGSVESSNIVAEGCSEDRVQEIQADVSRGIIGEAMATGRTIETANAQQDARFLDLRSVQRHQIEAVLCVPIGKDNPQGVIYLQGRAGSDSFMRFTPDTRADIELLARVVGVAIDRLAGVPSVRKRSSAEADDPFSAVVGHSAALKEIVEKLRFAAPLDVHVLLTGPSGSGKTQLAHAVHVASRRRARPFVELNCAAIPEALFENELFGAEPGAHSAVPRGGLKGKVEMAEGGTLFLDEVGELPLVLQAKILQLLQSKTYYPLGGSRPRQADVRVMAATNVRLKQAVAEKRFREDLYFRLKVLEVRVPSLAERAEDIVPLAQHFLRLALTRHDLSHKTISPSALRAIQVTEWTGNVRELAHQMEAAALNAELRGSDRVEPMDVFPSGPASVRIPESPAGLMPLHQATRIFQRSHIQSVLESTDWNMTETARALDISRAHLYTMVRSLDLKRSG